MRILGFMTGTSLDAVDMAVIETDGEEISRLGPAGEQKLDPAARALVERRSPTRCGWPMGEPTTGELRDGSRRDRRRACRRGRGFHAPSSAPAG